MLKISGVSIKRANVECKTSKHAENWNKILRKDKSHSIQKHGEK